MKKLLLLGLLLVWMVVPIASAQEPTVPVPDLTGLNMPQAAARLNEIGLRLGTEVTALWTASSLQPPNTISGQSVAPGTPVTAGSSVDITMLRAPNMVAIYDDNDITIVNRSGSIIDVSGMRLVSVEGNRASILVADRLQSFIREGQCLQIWSIWRNGPKAVDECRFIQGWLRDTPPREHFWTQTRGVVNFSILERGVERAICPAAPLGSEGNPLRCEFFFGGNSAAEVTPYIYFVYTPSTMAIINQSTDRWMPTDRSEIFKPNVEDFSLYVGNPAMFGNPVIVGDITLLAPGQCLLLTVNHPTDLAPPLPCTVIAYADINPQFSFWTAAFEIESATDGHRHGCPAALPDRPVICIVPQ